MSLQVRSQQIHQLYVRQDFDECLQLIEQCLQQYPSNEYALQTKAQIKRHQGQVQESLQLFQHATTVNPHNIANLKQVGKSLHLLGRHKAAADVYREAQNLGMDDWEVWHSSGLCHLQLRDLQKAEECFKRAIELEANDASYLQLGQLYAQQGDFQSAAHTYAEALEHSPDNAEILTTMGLLFLRTGDNQKAFDFLSSSLLKEPRSSRTILAAASIIQDHADMDGALVRYRVAAALSPNSPQLWNNIGMCFFGKQSYTAAIMCLKRALYLGPFEWIVSYNLGLVHLHTQQYASAFHHFSTSINLKPDFANSYMYLAVTLARLEDLDNACAAYEKACQMDPEEPVFRLNYSIMLLDHGDKAGARKQHESFQQLFQALDGEAQAADQDLLDKAQQLAEQIRA